MNAIEVHHLVKKFGDFTAVKGVTFQVRQGEVFGFLGPNGAGKSTTINMLCTLLRPTSGRATINGHDLLAEQSAVRQSIGLIFQDPSLDDRLTGRENLRFHAMLYDVSGDLFRQRSSELLEMVEMTDKADEVVHNYSGGMRRRLEIVRGLLHRPKVLFLDEPTTGLDPQTRRLIWNYLLRLRDREAVTMFMTTHYMDEAENCDRIAVIDHGEIIALGTPAELKGTVGGDVVTVSTSDNRLAAAILRTVYHVEPRIVSDGQLVIEVKEGDQFIPRMMATLAGRKEAVTVRSVNLRRPTLEDVFIKLTGRQIREEEAGASEQMRLGGQRWRH